MLLGLAVWLKPPLDRMGDSVERDLASYGREHDTEGGRPAVAEIESHDWVVAVSHVMKLADGATFSCFGAFKVTVATRRSDHALACNEKGRLARAGLSLAVRGAAARANRAGQF